MIRHVARGRSGITLTEILIAILIMGVGLISLATLFPLGLLRLRDAQRASRSSYLTESATADLEARNLLNKLTFSNLFYSPWNNLSPNLTTTPYDPWLQDTAFTTALPLDPTAGVYRGPSPPWNANLPALPGPGLPVAYDPLWRYQAQSYPFGFPIGTVPIEGRFASGVGFLRNDPDGGPASAYGLQRLTNFNPQAIAPNTVTLPTGVVTSLFGATIVPDTFVSPEDIILQNENGTQTSGNLSPIVPDMSNGSPVSDWRFSWMFTGQQSDATNGTIFNGDIVTFENRPFGISQQTLPAGGQQWTADGEIVVEGVFGYSTTVTPLPSNTAVGFATAAQQTVLLRWPSTMPDPIVKVGSWIADVTYERNLSVQTTRWLLPDYPYQRCYWYQVVKRTQPGPATTAFQNDTGTYRSMTVWVSTPLKAQTLLSVGSGQPVHVNAALIAPNVVNVFPRTIYTR